MKFHNLLKVYENFVAFVFGQVIYLTTYTKCNIFLAMTQNITKTALLLDICVCPERFAPIKYASLYF